MNQFAQELHTLALKRFSEENDTLLNSQWLEKYTKLKGKPFSFNRYPFQRQLVDDDSRRSVTIKPSQVGVSEVYQRVALMYLARHNHRKGIYAYPDDDMRKKNVQTRVMPMVEDTPAFSPEEVSKDWIRSIQLLQLNSNAFLYVTGSKVGDATSTDADYTFLDEYDLHDMSIAALFSSRLQNSDWKIEKYFSTPTFTEFGVHGLYTKSDQTEYLIKCDGCNHWQFPMFDRRWVKIPGLPTEFETLTDLTQDVLDTYHINMAHAHVCCEKCSRPLDLGRESNRNWVTKYPSRTAMMRGFRVNPFSVSTRPPIDIVVDLFKYKKNNFMRGFNNSVLGEPEDSSRNRIDLGDIRRAFRSAAIPEVDREMPTYVGIDIGHTCHVVVAQGEKATKMRSVIIDKVPLGEIKKWAARICETYNVVAGTCDRHPESQVAYDIWEITKGKIVPAEYRGTKEIELKMVPGEPDKVAYIQIDRTTSLDQVQIALREGHLEMYGYGMMTEEIETQLRNMVRIEDPETPAVWKKLDSNDHTFHAMGNMYSAIKLVPFTEIKVGHVLSTLGFGVATMEQFGFGLNGSKGKTWRDSNRLY